MSLLSAAVMLFLVIDPIGNIPLFMGILQRCDRKNRRRIIFREMIIALAVLLVFLFLGKYIPAAIRISRTALNISGGIILFIIAIQMIFPGRENMHETFEEEPLIVPLAIPLIAGPSAMATIILLTTSQPDKIIDWLLALLIAWGASFILLFFSEVIFTLLGKRVILAMQRLMGMILTTLAVQMVLNGVRNFING